VETLDQKKVALALSSASRQCRWSLEFRSDGRLARSAEVPGKADSCLPFAHRRRQSHNANSPELEGLRTFADPTRGRAMHNRPAGTLRLVPYPIVTISIGAPRARVRPEDRDDATDFSGTPVSDEVA